LGSGVGDIDSGLTSGVGLGLSLETGSDDGSGVGFGVSNSPTVSSELLAVSVI